MCLPRVCRQATLHVEASLEDTFEGGEIEGENREKYNYPRRSLGEVTLRCVNTALRQVPGGKQLEE